MVQETIGRASDGSRCSKSKDAKSRRLQRRSWESCFRYKTHEVDEMTRAEDGKDVLQSGIRLMNNHNLHRTVFLNALIR